MFLKAAFVYLLWSMLDPHGVSFYWSLLIGWWLNLIFHRDSDD